jgi:hypothetical protein
MAHLKRFLLDEHIPHGASVVLRRYGHSVLNLSAANLLHASDETLLRFCRETLRIFITCDGEIEQIVQREEFRQRVGVVYVKVHPISKRNVLALVEKLVADPRFSEQVTTTTFTTVTPEAIQYQSI